MSRIVVAVSGNALGEGQEEAAARTLDVARSIAPLVKDGHQVILCPGNGPQVGMISLVFDTGHEAGTSPPMPLPECTAMTQGYMGFQMQNAMDRALNEIGAGKRPTAAMLMQVVVSADDPAFSNPTRHVGESYTEKCARSLMARTGFKYSQDGEKGWRRVVPSPAPVDICEKKTLSRLLDHSDVVVAALGGGIPVVAGEDGYQGVSAVVGKDYAAEKVAEDEQAECLLILTGIDCVRLGYGTPQERAVPAMTPEDAKDWLAKGEFKTSGMRRKVDACRRFALSAPGRWAAIGPVSRAADTYAGLAGTRISQ